MSTEHTADSHGAEVVDAPDAFQTLIADSEDVARHLAEIPRQRVLTIPDRALALVAGLDAYGD